MMGACRHSACQSDARFGRRNSLVTRENSAYMNYYDEEVGMTSVDSVVMNEAEDEKNQMIDMAIEKNG
jgi:hypothetical protein